MSALPARRGSSRALEAANFLDARDSWVARGSAPNRALEASSETVECFWRPGVLVYER
jgi:hypothetical protein